MTIAIFIVISYTHLFFPCSFRVHLSFEIRQKFRLKFPRPRPTLPAPPPHTCDIFYKYEMHPFLSLFPVPCSLFPLLRLYSLT
ncbi:MAG: hypothetical protein F6J90_13790 [Moorea sp. SIOASIH]|nr:hypothetical protein [Moorena sp. SIOASIH]